MARPKKCRKVCCLPENTFFGPLGEASSQSDVTLFVDEYETIRLIDFEGLTQEECADKMHVARTTVQGIYAEARKKIADCIVNGKRIIIEGGDYRLCDGKGHHCGKYCQRRKYHGLALAQTMKENDVMRIAIPVESAEMNDPVCPSFGRTPQFLIYNMEDGSSTVIENSAANAQGGAGIKAAQILVDNQVKAVLTPHCGENAAKVLQPAGIALYKTTKGTVAKQIALFKENGLEPLTDIHPGYHKRG